MEKGGRYEERLIGQKKERRESMCGFEKRDYERGAPPGRK